MKKLYIGLVCFLIGSLCFAENYKVLRKIVSNDMSPDIVKFTHTGNEFTGDGAGLSNTTFDIWISTQTLYQLVVGIESDIVALTNSTNSIQGEVNSLKNSTNALQNQVTTLKGFTNEAHLGYIAGINWESSDFYSKNVGTNIDDEIPNWGNVTTYVGQGIEKNTNTLQEVLDAGNVAQDVVVARTIEMLGDNLYAFRAEHEAGYRVRIIDDTGSEGHAIDVWGQVVVSNNYEGSITEVRIGQISAISAQGSSGSVELGTTESAETVRGDSWFYSSSTSTGFDGTVYYRYYGGFGAEPPGFWSDGSWRMGVTNGIVFWDEIENQIWNRWIWFDPTGGVHAISYEGDGSKLVGVPTLGDIADLRESTNVIQAEVTDLQTYTNMLHSLQWVTDNGDTATNVAGDSVSLAGNTASAIYVLGRGDACTVTVGNATYALDIGGLTRIDREMQMSALAADPSTYADGGQIYTKTADSTNEVYVMDGEGNITQLSSHEGTEHIIKSFNKYVKNSGKTIYIERLAEMVVLLMEQNGISGTDKIIKRWNVAKVADWDIEQKELKIKKDAKIVEWKKAISEYEKAMKKWLVTRKGSQPVPPGPCPVEYKTKAIPNAVKAALSKSK